MKNTLSKEEGLNLLVYSKILLDSRFQLAREDKIKIGERNKIEIIKQVYCKKVEKVHLSLRNELRL